MIVNDACGAFGVETAIGLEVFPILISGISATVKLAFSLGATSIIVLGNGSYKFTSVPDNLLSLYVESI